VRANETYGRKARRRVAGKVISLLLGMLALLHCIAEGQESAGDPQLTVFTAAVWPTDSPVEKSRSFLPYSLRQPIRFPEFHLTGHEPKLFDLLREKSFSPKPLILPSLAVGIDREFLRTGIKHYLPEPFTLRAGRLQFTAERINVEGNILSAYASVRFTRHLDAIGDLIVDMAGQSLRGSFKVTIRHVPLVNQIRLVSKSCCLSRPRDWWFEPGLGRGFKLSVTDLNMNPANFFSWSEIQIPTLLGGRGFATAFALDQFGGMGLRFFIDLPNLEIPGTRWKLRLPNLSFALGGRGF
jgi:hypothetical protein